MSTDITSDLHYYTVQDCTFLLTDSQCSKPLKDFGYAGYTMVQTEQIGISDTRMIRHGKNSYEAIRLIEAYARKLGIVRKDAVRIAETYWDNIFFLIRIVENIVVTERKSNDLMRCLRDAFSVSDAIRKSFYPVKFDSFSLVDAYSRKYVHVLYDYVNMNDCIQKSPASLWNDSVSVQDTAHNDSQKTAKEMLSISNSLTPDGYRPVFTRASTAYKDDGTQVDNNVPRFGDSGLILKQAMTNILLNSNFSNGITNWFSQSGSLVSSENIAINTANGSDPTSNIIQNVQKITAVTGRVYYQAIDAMVTNSNCKYINMNLQVNTTGSATGGKVIIAPDADTWYHLSGIGTVQSVQNGYILRPMWIAHRYSDATTASGKVMKVKNPICIDLTAMFGAGYEPTLAQCDALFTEYVNGVQAKDDLSIPNSAIPSGDLSIDVWINPAFSTLQHLNPILYGISTANFPVALTFNNGSFEIDYKNASNITVVTYFGIPPTIFDGNTHKFKLTYSASTKLLTLYHAGTPIRTVTVTGFYTGGTDEFLIGANRWDSSLNGQVQQFRISTTCHTASHAASDVFLDALSVLPDTTYLLPLQGNLDYYICPELKKDIKSTKMESAVLSDINRTAYEKLYAETMAVTEAYRRCIGSMKKENIRTAETYWDTISFIVRILENVVIADKMARDLRHVIAVRMQVLDSVLKRVTAFKSETFKASDALDRICRIHRVFIETVQAIDDVSRQMELVKQDRIGLNDHKLISLFRRIRETVPIAESFNRDLTFKRIVKELLSIGDVLTKCQRKNIPEYLMIADAYVRACNAILENIRVSGDELTLDQFKKDINIPYAFEEFTDFNVGDYEYEKALMRLQIISNATHSQPMVYDMSLHVDVDDTNDKGIVEITDTTAATKVYYNKQYYNAPEVQVTLHGGTGNVFAVPFILSTDKSDEKGRYFEVELRDSTQNRVTGIISWVAKGW